MKIAPPDKPEQPREVLQDPAGPRPVPEGGNAPPGWLRLPPAIRHPAVKLLLRLVVSLLLMSLLFTQVDAASVARLLGQVDRWSLAIAIALVLVTQIPAAWAWKLLMDGQDLHLPFSAVGLMHLVGLFFAAFTPGGVGGDVMRTYRLNEWTKRGVASGVSVLALRLLSLVVLVLIVALASLARPDLPTSRLALAALATITIGTLALIAMQHGLRRVSARWLPPQAVAL